jgi:hypothetical protein
MEIVEHGRRVAGVGEQVKMQDNEAHRGQLALSDADGFWTPTGLPDHRRSPGIVLLILWLFERVIFSVGTADSSGREYPDFS